MQILSYNEFRRGWVAQRPNAVPKKDQNATVSWLKIVSMSVALIAINIVSGSHTIPTVAATIKSDSAIIRSIVGVSGFLSIEFTLFLMMLIPVSSNVRRLVIFLALSAAIVANLYSTTQAIGVDGWTLVVGIVIGLFGPLANVAFGEVFRHEFDRTAEQNSAIEAHYKEELVKLDSTIRSQYTTYLKKYGITDPTIVMQMLSDSTNTTEVALTSNATIALPSSTTPTTTEDSVTTVADSTPIVVKDSAATGDSVVSSGGSKKAVALAEALLRDSATTLSYSAIQKRYQVSPNTIKEAKKILSERSGGE